MQQKIINIIKKNILLFKYSFVSLLSFLIDYAIFLTLHYFGASLFYSLLVARVSSGAFNFYHNKYNVYQEPDADNIVKEALAYLLLALSVFSAAYLLIHFGYNYLHMNVLIAKVLVDGILFVTNFLVQKLIIFKRS